MNKLIITVFLIFFPLVSFATSYDCGLGKTMVIEHYAKTTTDNLTIDGNTIVNGANERVSIVVPCVGVHTISDNDNEETVFLFDIPPVNISTLTSTGSYAPVVGQSATLGDYFSDQRQYNLYLIIILSVAFLYFMLKDFLPLSKLK